MSNISKIPHIQKEKSIINLEIEKLLKMIPKPNTIAKKVTSHQQPSHKKS